MDDLKELRALRDRLLQTVGWYTGKAENGNTEVKTDDVIQRLRWVLNGEEPRWGPDHAKLLQQLLLVHRLGSQNRQLDRVRHVRYGRPAAWLQRHRCLYHALQPHPDPETQKSV